MANISFMKKEEVTFEKLPEAIGYLIDKVESLEKTLQTKEQQSNKVSDCWFNVDELIEYLSDKPAKATVYGWVSTRQIPHHKSSKKLRFLKSEIDKWLSSGKRKSEDELQAEALEFTNHKKGGRKYE
jgi:predicted DNA-binding transcriptional regulator AlpA